MVSLELGATLQMKELIHVDPIRSHHFKSLRPELDTDFLAHPYVV